MKVMFEGKATINKMVNNIKEIISGVNEKLELPAEAKVKVEGVSFNVVYTINGEDMYLSIPREIQGQEVNDMFTVAVKLDEKGNISLTDNNEEKPFVDEKTLVEHNGGTYQYSTIESAYEDHELIEMGELKAVANDDETAEDIVKSVRYKLKADETKEVVRFYKGSKLVAEQLIDADTRDNTDIA